MEDFPARLHEDCNRDQHRQSDPQTYQCLRCGIARSPDVFQDQPWQNLCSFGTIQGKYRQPLAHGKKQDRTGECTTKKIECKHPILYAKQNRHTQQYQQHGDHRLDDGGGRLACHSLLRTEQDKRRNTFRLTQCGQSAKTPVVSTPNTSGMIIRANVK